MCSLLLALVLSSGQPAAVRVYVFTQTDVSGFVDAATKSRIKAVEGLKKTIGQSKTLQLVDAAAEATIHIEIMKTEDIEEADALSALNNALNGAHNSDTKKVTYRYATLRMGEYSTELKGKENLKTEHALSRQIEAWVKDNAPRLTAR